MEAFSATGHYMIHRRLVAGQCLIDSYIGNIGPDSDIGNAALP